MYRTRFEGVFSHANRKQTPSGGATVFDLLRSIRSLLRFEMPEYPFSVNRHWREVRSAAVILCSWRKRRDVWRSNMWTIRGILKRYPVFNPTGDGLQSHGAHHRCRSKHPRGAGVRTQTGTIAGSCPEVSSHSYGSYKEKAACFFPDCEPGAGARPRIGRAGTRAALASLDVAWASPYFTRSNRSLDGRRATSVNWKQVLLLPGRNPPSTS